MVLGPDCIRAQEHEGRDEVIRQTSLSHGTNNSSRIPISALPRRYTLSVPRSQCDTCSHQERNSLECSRVQVEERPTPGSMPRREKARQATNTVTSHRLHHIPLSLFEPSRAPDGHPGGTRDVLGAHHRRALHGTRTSNLQKLSRTLLAQVLRRHHFPSHYSGFHDPRRRPHRHRTRRLVDMGGKIQRRNPIGPQTYGRGNSQHGQFGP